MQVRINEIIVNKRVRKNMGDLTSLAKSLDKFGQLNPITITPGKHLIAGHRRLKAAKLLGWETINARVITDLSEITKLEIEVEENLNRLPLTMEELDNAYKQIERLKRGGFFWKLIQWLKNFFRRIFKIND